MRNRLSRRVFPQSHSLRRASWPGSSGASPELRGEHTWSCGMLALPQEPTAA